MRTIKILETIPDAAGGFAGQSGTKVKILDRAIRLFADGGFNSVSVRDITESAKVNPAAIGYHFGSKDDLIRVAIGAVFAPITAARLRELKSTLDAASGRALSIESVVEALVRPTVGAVLLSDGYEQYYARYAVLAYALDNSFLYNALSGEHDVVATSFLDAIAGALPKVTREKVCWCYDFAIGSTVHVLLDREREYRLQKLSDGLCDTGDPEIVTDRLVSFIVGGMKSFVSRAPPDGRSAKRPARRQT